MMDGPPDDEGRGGGGGKKTLRIFVLRCLFTSIFSLVAYFFFSFLLGLLAFAIGSFSKPHSILVPAECRIVSSGVDLRSSKVCELGVANYKAKRVFYPFEKTRIRCHDDYYWASVFKVEYKEYFSGQTFHAVAEAPKEALPLECRPSFGTAWLTKTKFKVNETYKCRYAPGTHEADISPDNLFNCQAKDPSTAEMVRRFFILFSRSINSFSANKGRAGRSSIIESAAGLVAGMLSSLCLVILFRVVQMFRLTLSRKWNARKVQISVLFRRACFLVAYISAMAWLSLQYSSVIGLKELLFSSRLADRSITR